MVNLSNININEIKTEKLNLDESLRAETQLKAHFYKNIVEIENKVNDIETRLLNIDLNSKVTELKPKYKLEKSDDPNRPFKFTKSKANIGSNSSPKSFTQVFEIIYLILIVIKNFNSY